MSDIDLIIPSQLQTLRETYDRLGFVYTVKVSDKRSYFFPCTLDNKKLFEAGNLDVLRRHNHYYEFNEQGMFVVYVSPRCSF